jgi:hypothetical protein
MNTPSLFDIQPTIDRRNESWYSTPETVCSNQLLRVMEALRKGGKTSRQISDSTGIERTSVTRVLSVNKKLFDDTQEQIDTKTGKRVTVYRLKEEAQ